MRYLCVNKCWFGGIDYCSIYPLVVWIANHSGTCYDSVSIVANPLRVCGMSLEWNKTDHTLEVTHAINGINRFEWLMSMCSINYNGDQQFTQTMNRSFHRSVAWSVGRSIYLTSAQIWQYVHGPLWIISKNPLPFAEYADKLRYSQTNFPVLSHTLFLYLVWMNIKIIY